MSVCIVTGGFGVLGRAVAKAAMTKGLKAALIDVAEDVPSDLASDSGAICFGGVNLTNETAVCSLFEKIDREQGGVSILVNVAGGFTWSPVAQAAADQWQKMYEINVLTALSASRAAIPALQLNQGSIVNIGAYAALQAKGGMGPYTAAKAGVHRLTEALAEELRESKVRVNAVLPSIIDTPTNRRDMPDADFASWVAPDALAKVILFLASPDASAVNGVLLPVTN